MKQTAEMETAAQQLTRGLPAILQRDARTQGISSRGIYLNESYVNAWIDFDEDVKAFIRTQDLSFEVPAEMSQDEKVLVGNESSLVGRFIQNVGVPLGRVMLQVPSQNLLFGDAYTGVLDLTKNIPDVIILEETSGVVHIVGEVKPFWLLHLDNANPIAPRTMALAFGPLGENPISSVISVDTNRNRSTSAIYV
jgi:hypothetical protein